MSQADPLDGGPEPPFSHAPGPVGTWIRFLLAALALAGLIAIWRSQDARKGGGRPEAPPAAPAEVPADPGGKGGPPQPSPVTIESAGSVGPGVPAAPGP